MCLHGGARSFTSRLVHSTQRQHIIDALGANVTTFLHVTRKDAPYANHKSAPRAVTTTAQLYEAASVVGITNENVHIHEGPSFDLPKCPAYAADYTSRKLADACYYERDVNACNAVKHSNFAARYSAYPTTTLTRYAQSLAGQLSHRRGCMELIEADETRSGKLYDSVLLMRADLAVWMPFRPHCMYNLKVARRKQDWLYWVSRHKAAAYFHDPWHVFYGCKKPFPQGLAIEYYPQKFLDGANIANDAALPVILTRVPDAFRFDSSVDLCTYPVIHFATHGHLNADPGPHELCLPMTFENRHHRMLSGANISTEWSGDCASGELAAVSERVKHNQCGACHHGHKLSMTTRCPRVSAGGSTGTFYSTGQACLFPPCCCPLP